MTRPKAMQGKRDKKKRAGGRPTKFTAEVVAKIIDAIAKGNYKETAAAYAGIHRETLNEWLKRGEADREAGMQTEFSAFSDALEQALAEAEIRDVAIIGKAAESNWQAAAWRLERKFGDRWGRKANVAAGESVLIVHLPEVRDEG